MALQKIINTSIEVGESQTPAILLNELMVSGFITGSGLTATSLIFLVSVDGNTFYPLYNADGQVSFSDMGGGTARAVSISPAEFFPWNFVKFQGGTSASPVLQTTEDCPITISARLM